MLSRPSYNNCDIRLWRCQPTSRVCNSYRMNLLLPCLENTLICGEQISPLLFSNKGVSFHNGNHAKFFPMEKVSKLYTKRALPHLFGNHCQTFPEIVNDVWHDCVVVSERVIVHISRDLFPACAPWLRNWNAETKSRKLGGKAKHRPSAQVPAGFVVASPAVGQQGNIKIERLNLCLPCENFGPGKSWQA